MTGLNRRQTWTIEPTLAKDVEGHGEEAGESRSPANPGERKLEKMFHRICSNNDFSQHLRTFFKFPQKSAVKQS